MKYHRIKRRWWRSNLYQLDEELVVQTEIRREKGISPIGKFYRLLKDGTLKIFMGFTWDGPSGPTYDTENSMRASLVHDVLYAMIREGYTVEREAADREFRRLAKEDGMSGFRVGLWFHSLRIFGGYAARRV